MSVVPKPPMTSTDDPLPDLIRALRSRVPADRLRAAKDLGRLGWLAREALPALVAALADEDAKVREAAAHAVGQMGPDALPDLAGMLTHDDKYVRRNAVWALGKLGQIRVAKELHAFREGRPNNTSRPLRTGTDGLVQRQRPVQERQRLQGVLEQTNESGIDGAGLRPGGGHTDGGPRQ